MSATLPPDEIQRRAKKAGKSIEQICREAGVAPSTFWRWLNGTTHPGVDVYDLFIAAIEQKGDAP